MANRGKVAYFYDGEVGGAYYGPNHPMKPHRICMAHELIIGYGLHKHMDVYKPRKAYTSELLAFHDPYYIDYLASVNVDNQLSKGNNFDAKYVQYNMGEDCPVFDGLYDFCQLYTGASLEGARKLNSGQCDIAINWSGGLHHAKKGRASGFCYVNDLVLAILELLKYNARVLYVDIDVHHGDGVEEAFYLTDRVMTVSFHQYGNHFFPGSGSLKDKGEKRGLYHVLNVPMAPGTTDATFHSLFKPIMRKVIEVYSPTAIVLQSGADSLGKDRLGNFNLSVAGHGEAVRFMKKFNIPMLVTGGGGYTKTNVARCWTYETAILIDKEIGEDLPDNTYKAYYVPDYKLNSSSTISMDNYNLVSDIENTKITIMEYLRHLNHTPAVQMNYAPKSDYLPVWDLEGNDESSERLTAYARDHRLLEDMTEYWDD